MRSARIITEILLTIIKYVTQIFITIVDLIFFVTDIPYLTNAD